MPLPAQLVIQRHAISGRKEIGVGRAGAQGVFPLEVGRQVELEPRARPETTDGRISIHRRRFREAIAPSRTVNRIRAVRTAQRVVGHVAHRYGILTRHRFAQERILLACHREDAEEVALRERDVGRALTIAIPVRDAEIRARAVRTDAERVLALLVAPDGRLGRGDVAKRHVRRLVGRAVDFVRKGQRLAAPLTTRGQTPRQSHVGLAQLRALHIDIVSLTE